MKTLPDEANFDTLINKAKDGDVEPLVSILIKFFINLRVERAESDALPKQATIDCYRSHLSHKSQILHDSDGKVNIIGKAVFRWLDQCFLRLWKALKGKGKGDTDHTKGLFKIFMHHDIITHETTLYVQRSPW